MLFQYKGFDQLGKSVSSKIEALTISEAKQKLKQRDIVCTQISEKRFQSSFNLSFHRQKISAEKLSLLSRDLSIYLNSGISLIRAISLLKDRFKMDKKMKSFFEIIETYLEEGKDFFTALDKQKIFELPEFYKQSIKVSQSSGLLEQVLKELSIFLKEQDKIKKQFTSAIAYPLFILVVSFFMVGFMLSVVVPQITSIFAKQENELPWITLFVVDLGEFVSNNYIFILLIITIVISSFFYFRKKFYPFKYFIDTLYLKMPFFKSIVELNDLSRFAYMNSILIRSGVPIVHSIKLSANILKNSVLQNIFQTASKKVVEGEKLSNILEKNIYYKIDTTFIQAIAIGEETSQMPDILNNLAVLYNEANKDKLGILISLLEPFLMLVVGMIIGFIVLAMLLPIFSMSIS